MINIVTIHWLSDQWIDLQLDNLERNVAAPFRVFASLNGVERDRWQRFHFAEDLTGPHPVKLNALARRIAEESEPTDVLMFLDGDAFPVQPLVPWLDHALAEHPLLAVRRLENGGDLRPHPSFCVTTVGFWQTIGGDWQSGRWRSPSGEEFLDAGTTLYETLQKEDVDWLPLLRTNTHDLHPLWFAIYGHRIYHHGAGFRSRFSYADASIIRVDARNARTWVGPPTLGRLTRQVRRHPSKLLSLRPHHIVTIGRSGVKTARRRVMGRYARRAESLSSEVFRRLNTDPTIFHELDSAVGQAPNLSPS